MRSVCVYKCRKSFLQCPLFRIQSIPKLKLQGELSCMYHKVLTIAQISSQLDSYPDDSWVMISGHQPLFRAIVTKTPCKVWTIFPLAVSRWVVLPATLKYPLSWLGHLLCQICTLRVQTGSLLLITLSFIPFCWQVLAGASAVLCTSLYPPWCLINPGTMGRRYFWWVCCLELVISISCLTFLQP